MKQSEIRPEINFPKNKEGERGLESKSGHESATGDEGDWTMTRTQKKSERKKVRRLEKTAEKQRVAISEHLSSTAIEPLRGSHPRRSELFGSTTAISEEDITLEMNTVIDVFDDSPNRDDTIRRLDLTIQNLQTMIGPIIPASPTLIGLQEVRREQEEQDMWRDLDKETVERIMQREISIKTNFLASINSHVEKIESQTIQIEQKDAMITAMREDYLENHQTKEKVDNMEQEFEYLREELASARRLVADKHAKATSNPTGEYLVNGERAESAESQKENRNTAARLVNSDQEERFEAKKQTYERNSERSQPQDGDTNRTGNRTSKNQTTNNQSHATTTFYPRQESTFFNNQGNDGDEENSDGRRRRQREIKSSHQDARPTLVEEEDKKEKVEETKINRGNANRTRYRQPRDPNDPSSPDNSDDEDGNIGEMMRRRRANRGSNSDRGQHGQHSYRDRQHNREDSDERRRQRQRGDSMERRKKREREDEEYRRHQKLEDRRYQEERDQKKLQIEH